MKFHEHVDTTYPKINYKLQLLTRQTTRDIAHTKPPNGSNSESRWGARNQLSLAKEARYYSHLTEFYKSNVYYVLTINMQW
jgi:hypothetical protein